MATTSALMTAEELLALPEDGIDRELIRGELREYPMTTRSGPHCTAMKLSEFRGKVVLLSFWATWCSPCMQMVPHERTIVQRLDGKPFALVGVNGDDDQKAARAATATHGMTWRSFQDENEPQRISLAWHVWGWPTLYLIDHEGIIRKRWVGTHPEELNHAIDQLIAEQAQGKDEPKADFDRIQGTWNVSRTEVNGKPLKLGIAIKITFDGDKLLATTGKRPPEPRGTFKLDPSQEPKAYDVLTPEGQMVPGIYVLEGDTLKVCLGTPGDERPTSFTTHPDDGRTLIVYQRQKP